MAAVLVRAREALGRQAWHDAYALFASADSDGPLQPGDLENAALAAYLTGRDAESDALWERAYRAYLDASDPRRAARAAFWLGLPLALRGETARGGGWLARGARLVAGLPECSEQALLAVPAALRTLTSGDPKGSSEAFAGIAELGERLGDPDVLAFGRLGGGQALIASGSAQEGLSLLDEAMVAVTADAVSPITTGLVYCAVLRACQETFDLARAEEWTAVLTRWCATQQGLVPFRGECLVHRAEVLQARGEWTDALAEAERACAWLAGRPAEGRARYQLGELHRLRGEVADAEHAYRAASAAGSPPQPGCALLRLEQGRADAAAAMLEAALLRAGHALARGAVLPACVEVAVARGALDEARGAAEELAALAAGRDAPLLSAHAAHARGVVLVAEGDPHAALGPLHESCTQLERLSAPYELARTRVELGRACRELGDTDGAASELETARDTFARLGAALDLDRVDRIAGQAPPEPAGLSPRELEVLALVAGGSTNREIAAVLVVSPHTVRRHLQNAFRKLGVSSRAAAAAYAVRHGLAPEPEWHERTTR